MESSKPGIYFFECGNPHCGLRFPLDAGLYDGRYCPRCGAPLARYEPGIPAQKSPAATNSRTKIIGAVDNIRSAHNVGSIFRTADGAGLSELLLGGITPTPADQPAISKTALGAEKNMKWRYHANLPEALAQLKAENHLILALEYVPGASSLQDFHINHSLPAQVVLVAGSEPAGVDPAVLRIADQVLFIPMSGAKTSLNVSVAFGIAIYQLLWM